MPDSVAAPPSHLKYLSLDGFGGDEETDGWANLAFLGLQGPGFNGQTEWKGVNETLLQRNLDNGYDMLIDVRATPAPPLGPPCLCAHQYAQEVTRVRAHWLRRVASL